MEQHQADFDKKMNDMMAGVRVQLGQKLGIDNPQPKVHTNTQSDDSVIITREDRPL
jgi:ribosomal protein L1